MPRTADPDKRILHPSYQWAYLLTRGKTFYSVIHSHERSTGIKAEPKNISFALEILEQRLKEYLNPHKQKIVEDAAKEFLEQKLRNSSKSDIKKYLHILGSYLDGITYVSDTNVIRSRLYEKIRSNTIEYHTENNGRYKDLSSYYKKLRTEIAKISEFFDFCIEVGYCTKNPVTIFMLHEQTANEPEPFTKEEIDAIINQLRTGERYRLHSGEREELILLIRLISTAGIRIGEALALKKSDIESNGLKIESETAKGTFKTRYIPFQLLPELSSLCLVLKNYNEGEKVFSWNNRKNPADNFKAAMAAIGMNTEGRSMHSLRKSALIAWEKELGLPKELRNRLAGVSGGADGVYEEEEQS